MLLQTDITEILPYLNAALEDGVYDHGAKVLLWESDGIRYAFRPLEIAVAPVVDREAAQEIAQRVTDMVNRVWSRRQEIEPDFEGQRPLPHLLDAYRLLPRTNCKECGYPTCMAYAADLREARAKLAQCAPLSLEQYTENRDQLILMLQLTDF